MSATPSLPPECSRVVIDTDEIAEKVRMLGQEITRAHRDQTIRLITVLRGGAFFLADLCRAIELDVRIDFLAVAPYVPGAPGAVRVTKDLDDDIEGSRVILVEDVMDTGLTANYVRRMLLAHGPASLEVCALLDKPARRIADVPIDYTGFHMSDRFLVGYGLDLGGRYRNLPFIAELKQEAVFS